MSIHFSKIRRSNKSAHQWVLLADVLAELCAGRMEGAGPPQRYAAA